MAQIASTYEKTCIHNAFIRTNNILTHSNVGIRHSIVEVGYEEFGRASGSLPVKLYIATIIHIMLPLSSRGTLRILHQ